MPLSSCQKIALVLLACPLRLGSASLMRPARAWSVSCCTTAAFLLFARESHAACYGFALPIRNGRRHHIQSVTSSSSVAALFHPLRAVARVNCDVRCRAAAQVDTRSTTEQVILLQVAAAHAMSRESAVQALLCSELQASLASPGWPLASNSCL